jgi:hypothetical protein
VQAAQPDPNTFSSNSVFWDFGSGATPANGTFDVGPQQKVAYSSSVTYSTPGHKITTLTSAGTGGCSSINTYELDIYDCSDPVIPHDAIVINSDTSVVGPGKTYWVNPGFTLSFRTVFQEDTVFAEPGSTVIGVYSLCYMKPGSVFNTDGGSNRVIFGDGASINARYDDFTFNCPNLNFDYSNAPPNPAHPSSSVKNDLTSVPITVSPNPTGGMLSVQGLPSDNITVSVFNTLGQTVMVQKNPPAPDFTLDLSKFVPSVYYIRFSSANSVVTKKIVRE